MRHISLHRAKKLDASPEPNTSQSLSSDIALTSCLFTHLSLFPEKIHPVHLKDRDGHCFFSRNTVTPYTLVCSPVTWGIEVCLSSLPERIEGLSSHTSRKWPHWEGGENCFTAATLSRDNRNRGLSF